MMYYRERSWSTLAMRSAFCPPRVKWATKRIENVLISVCGVTWALTLELLLPLSSDSHLSAWSRKKKKRKHPGTKPMTLSKPSSVLNKSDFEYIGIKSAQVWERYVV